MLDPDRVATNIVFFDLAPEIDVTATGLAERLADEFQIRVSPEGPRALRALTHYWISDSDVRALVAAVGRVLGEARTGSG